MIGTDEAENTTPTTADGLGPVPEAGVGGDPVSASPPPPAEEDFGAAFDRMTAPGEEPKEPPAPVEAKAPEPAPEEPTSPSVEEPTSPSEETSAKISDEDLLARFAEIVKGKAQEQAPPQPEPQQQPQQPQEAPQYFSTEEVELLKKYEEEWPDVAKAEAIRRSAEYKQLVGYVFQEVAKEFTPLVNQLQALATRTHLSDLQTTVPDYADVRDRVIDWAQNQPPYLRAAYNHVIQHGTVDEVSDLITRFRQETGANTQAPPPVQRKTKPDLPPATKQAVAALAPVSSKRSAVIQGVDTADFDTAFDMHANRRAS